MNSPLISVVIPSWNLKDDLIACIVSLLASSIQPLHICVVDNASTDGTAEALQDRFGAKVEVIGCAENRGFAYAVNKGIDLAVKAGAEFILILNNDTIVERRMVAQLVEALKQTPTAGIAGPVIYYYEPAGQIWQIGDRQWLGPPLSWHIPEAKVDSQLLKVDYVTGCAMLIKREVFEAIGKFDEQYLMYFEDADFCQRARAAGFEIVVNPAAKLWHKVSRSTRNLVPKRIFDQSRSRVIFLNRHSPSLLWLLAQLYIWTRLIIEAGRYLGQGHPGLAKSAFAGAWAGYAFFWQQRR